MSMKDFVFGFTISGVMQSSFNSAFTKATQKVKDLDKAMSENKEMVKALDAAYSAHTISQNSYTAGIAKLNKEMAKMNHQKNISQGIVDMNNHMKQAGSHMMSAVKWAGAFGGALAIPIKESMEFESAMAEVRKVVDFDTPQQFKQMGKDIVEMSTKMPMAAKDIAQIVAAGGQAGIAREDLKAFAEAAVKMGIAFDTTAEDAGQKMANWRTAFKMTQPEVNELADKINYLGNNTAASALTISDIVTRIGPLGKVAGVASGEIAAMGASISGTGIPAEIAATGFKNMVLALNAGDSATKMQSAAFAKLGLNATDMAKRMQTDAKGGILQVLEAIKKLPEAEQAATLTQLFGKESVAAIAPLLANLDNLKHNFELVADKEKYAHSVDKEYAARCNTTANQMNLLRNAGTALAINLGSALLPAVNSLLGPLVKAAKGLADFAGEHPGVITACVAVAGAITGLVVAVNICKSAFAAAKAAWIGATVAMRMVRYAAMLTSGAFNILTVKQNMARIASIAFRAIQLLCAPALWACTAAQWAFNAALNANPIGVVILAIAALIGIGYELYTHWQEVSNFLTNMWDSPITKILLFLGGPVGWLIAAGLAIIANWDVVKQWFVTLWENPGLAIQQFVDGARNVLGSLFGWAEDKWNTLKHIFEQPITVTIKKLFSGGDNGGKPNVAKNARGGIYNKGAFLTTFAEDSGESAIPHTPTARNIGLLAQTNAIMGNPLGVGVNNNNSSSSTVNLSYAPVINVNGGGDVNMAQIESALKEQVADLQRMLSEIQNQKRRVSYA